MTSRLHRLLLFLLLAAAGPLRADPDAQAILKTARLAHTGQDQTFTGHLRVQATGRIVPFTLALSGSTFRYQFADGAIILRLTDNGAQLMEAAHGDTRKISPARFDKPVEGTDITYEDISLQFLFWTKAKIDGSELVDGLNCWKLNIEPGGQPSAYGAVLLWVSKRTGDFLAGEGYDHAGNLVKRFKVISGQQNSQGGWMLKKMRIETLGGGKDSITYLEIDKGN